ERPDTGQPPHRSGCATHGCRSIPLYARQIAGVTEKGKKGGRSGPGAREREGRQSINGRAVSWTQADPPGRATYHLAVRDPELWDAVPKWSCAEITVGLRELAGWPGWSLRHPGETLPGASEDSSPGHPRFRPPHSYFGT